MATPCLPGSNSSGSPIGGSVSTCFDIAKPRAHAWGRRQRFENATFRDCTAPTLIDHAAEFASEGSQIGNFSVDLGPMLPGNNINSLARLIALVGEIEQGTNLIKREAELPRTPDEAQPVQMRRIVGAIIT